MGAIRPFSGSRWNFGKPPHAAIRGQSRERPEPGPRVANPRRHCGCSVTNWLAALDPGGLDRGLGWA